MLEDWMIEAWMILSLLFLILILLFLWNLRKKATKILQKQEDQDEKLFQLALFSRPVTPLELPMKAEEFRKKGGWPKGKRRKEDI